MISELVINTTADPRTTRLSRVHGAMVGESLVIVMISELVINTTAGPRTTRLSRVHGAMVGEPLVIVMISELVTMQDQYQASTRDGASTRTG